MSEGEEKQGPGFVVIDKRGQDEDPPEESPAEATAEAPPPQGNLPQVDFATLALSLATSAMLHLGLVADPSTGEVGEKNLPLAHQTIDTLEMLQAKTKGNLDEEEEKLLQNLLTELRMRYVEASR